MTLALRRKLWLYYGIMMPPRECKVCSGRHYLYSAMDSCFWREDWMVLDIIPGKQVLERRRTKRACDYDRWQNDIDALACTLWDDCRGCGAYEESS